ncbi:MAG: hypothetical protein LBG80_04660 [Bacteroidales bacterium]|jgi:hypothetical protein|nr:hypothetical protein [Bacteroidales bacterium]
MAQTKKKSSDEVENVGVSASTDLDESTRVDTPTLVLKNAERAKEIFKTYPSREVIYFTSDGYAFFEKSDAKNHGNSLEKKEIETIKKDK